MAWAATLGDSLRELFVSNNRIRKIEGLTHHKNLQVLELGSNRIRNIEVSTFSLARNTDVMTPYCYIQIFILCYFG